MCQNEVKTAVVAESEQLINDARNLAGDRVGMQEKTIPVHDYRCRFAGEPGHDGDCEEV